MTPEKIDEICQDVRKAMTDVFRAADQMQEQQLRVASGLPEWNRAQVLSHICGIACAIARQLDFARVGNVVALYDGEAQGRLNDIESRLSMSLVELKQAVADAFCRLDVSLEAMSEGDWSRSVAYRSGTAQDALLAVWRELVIHHADLRLSYTSADWSEEFCSHIFDFLAERVPDGLTLEFHIIGERSGPIDVGSGASRVVMSGSRQDLTTWLSGREPMNEIECQDVLLPQLAPWPSAAPTQ